MSTGDERGFPPATGTPHPICVLLRELRQAAGLSLGQIEEKFGIAAVVLGSYERGDREPPLRKLVHILSLYGYRLEAVPVGAQVIRPPADMVSDLRAIADQLERKEAHDDAVLVVPPAAA